MKNITIKELLSTPEISINFMDLWYDWFCRESSLENKGKNLLKKLKLISSSKKFDNEKTYVFFKNNCPCVGSLYDDFRICDVETGNVLYTVVPASGFKCEKGKAIVYGHENNFQGALISGTWKEIKNWFLAN